eukprot:s227_g8.t1
MFFDSSDSTMIDTGHQNEWADIELPDRSVKKCENQRGPTGHRWTGYTLFVPLGRPTAGENAEQETEDRSAVKPKMLKVPGLGSLLLAADVLNSHLPYRDWCEHCVKSKGRQSHAVKKKKKNDRQPVIQIGFSFMATENDLPKRTILNATDVQTGYSMAVVLPSKGSLLLDWSVLRKKKLKGMLSLKTWYLIGVGVSLSRIYCFKMAMIELLLKWIMIVDSADLLAILSHAPLIQMHLRLSRQLSK